jgi:hypothetical protein
MGKDKFNFTDWGWAVKHGKCVPVGSSLTPAAEELLKLHVYTYCTANVKQLAIPNAVHAECSVACFEYHGSTFCKFFKQQSECEGDEDALELP